MTQQIHGTPELKYSEEAFRDMYEALKELDYCYSSGAYQDRKRVANAWVEAKKVLTKAEGK